MKAMCCPCVLAKQMLVKKTYCLVKKSEYVDLVPNMMKVNSVVDTRKVVINSIIRFLRRGNLASVASLRDIDAEVIEFVVERDSTLLNKKISDINFPQGASIGAILRDDEIIFAYGKQTIALDDRLLVFYLPSAAPKLKGILGRKDIAKLGDFRAHIRCIAPLGLDCDVFWPWPCCPHWEWLFTTKRSMFGPG